MTWNRAVASFEDDFEVRRHADATLRLQRISTLLIREGSNGGIYNHVLDAAIDLMSADMGSIQAFHPGRCAHRLLAEQEVKTGSGAQRAWAPHAIRSP